MHPVDFVVATSGGSSLLERCLGSIEETVRAAEIPAKLILVAQGSAATIKRPGWTVLCFDEPLGFAKACNVGIAQSSAPFVALVNDDAVLEPLWLQALLAAMRSNPRVGSAQGVNVAVDDATRIDGWGIGWSLRWQATQLGHGSRTAPSRRTEVFGVSATAALYRREALADIADAAEALDERLDSYYEDVELAVRLRQRGWSAVCEPSARAQHQGAASFGSQPRRRVRRLVRNRHLVVARLQGRNWPLVLPRLLLGDVIDGIRRNDPLTELRPIDLVASWWGAALLLPRFVHLGRPCDPQVPMPVRRGEHSGDAGSSNGRLE